MTPPLLTATAAAKYLGLSRPTLLRLTRNGHIPCFVDPDTGWRRYSRPALDEWLRGNCPSPSNGEKAAS